MNRYNMLAAAIATALAAGCATPPAPPGGAPDDKTYVTGSRLPSRDADNTSPVNSNGNKQDIHDMMQRPNPGAATGGGR
jgi:hypothetical protein